MKKVTLAIFDMDGLMFDTEILSNTGWKLGGKAYGCEVTDLVLRDVIGRNIPGTRVAFHQHFGDRFPYDDAKRIRDQYIADSIEKNGVPLKPGLPELLEYLQKNGIHAAMATSTDQPIAVKYLEMTGIGSKFGCVVCGNEVKNGKPAPDIFLMAAQRLGCCPSECIVLEDSDNGIRAAYAGEMRPILIPDRRQPPDEIKALAHRVFISLHDVISYLQSP